MLDLSGMSSPAPDHLLEPALLLPQDRPALPPAWPAPPTSSQRAAPGLGRGGPHQREGDHPVGQPRALLGEQPAALPAVEGAQVPGGPARHAPADAQGDPGGEGERPAPVCEGHHCCKSEKERG